MTAFSRGDAASVAAAYTEHGQVLAPNSNIIAGRQQIQTFYQGVIEYGDQGRNA
jgi:ketosteroid isomerase-like protein